MGQEVSSGPNSYYDHQSMDFVESEKNKNIQYSRFESKASESESESASAPQITFADELNYLYKTTRLNNEKYIQSFIENNFSQPLYNDPKVVQEDIELLKEKFKKAALKEKRYETIRIYLDKESDSEFFHFKGLEKAHKLYKEIIIGFIVL